MSTACATKSRRSSGLNTAFRRRSLRSRRGPLTATFDIAQVSPERSRGAFAVGRPSAGGPLRPLTQWAAPSRMRRRRHRRLVSRLPLLTPPRTKRAVGAPLRGVEKRPLRVGSVDAGGGCGDPRVVLNRFSRRVRRPLVANQRRRRGSRCAAVLLAHVTPLKVVATRAARSGDTPQERPEVVY